QNPLVKKAKRLRQKKYRRQENAFFVEGLRVVLTAVEQKAPIQTLIYAPDLLTSETALQAVAAQEKAGLDCVAVSSDIFAAISGRDNPAGLGAIIESTWHDLDSLIVSTADLWLALIEVGDPGNLGTILRTADAFGIAGVILVGRSVDPFHPTAVKASMGTLFTLPVVQADHVSEVLTWAAQYKLQTIATSAKASQPIRQTAVQYPALLLLGSEGEGLSEDILAAADLRVTIPMSGTVTSLNLAIAASILMYELNGRSKST
ncbi:MAG: RNA methyltransferase, partial [Candidatus Promineifilaceae bacterium]